MIRSIVLWPDPVLATLCAPVERIDDEVRQLAADMLETMYAAPGRGLAAPQVGVALRLFVMDAGWKNGESSPRILINPEIVTESQVRVSGPEGCLSIPGVTAEVERAESLTMRWTSLDGAMHEEDLSGFEAVCAQHEFDHLNGIVTFDRIALETREELEKVYAA
ncbi:peptide deformylase [Silicimonas sp. MF1-12-2]|uniref:peptide deformylase n=1 Tax=Silicimonas sp. MF1-12-2 TaxID=3384793 RepID=UPI0039B5E4C9